MKIINKETLSEDETSLSVEENKKNPTKKARKNS